VVIILYLLLLLCTYDFMMIDVIKMLRLAKQNFFSFIFYLKNKSVEYLSAKKVRFHLGLVFLCVHMTIT